MKILTNLRISQKALLKQKMRTILALLGIIVGVSAVIILVAIGNGARQEVVSNIEEMGTNLLIVTAGDVNPFAGRRKIRGKVTTLTPEDADAVINQLASVEAVVPLQSKKMQVKYGSVQHKYFDCWGLGTLPVGSEFSYSSWLVFLIRRKSYFKPGSGFRARCR